MRVRRRRPGIVGSFLLLSAGAFIWLVAFRGSSITPGHAATNVPRVSRCNRRVGAMSPMSPLCLVAHSSHSPALSGEAMNKESSEDSPREYTFNFTHEGVTCNVGVTSLGSGPGILLLPALSSISTRSEMQGVQEALASSGFEAVAVDWPGLGSAAKPQGNWSPSAYDDFLTKVLTDVVPSPVLVVAAGHAAGYLLRVAERLPDAFGRAVLVSPTWRGPVPTMLHGRRPSWLRTIVRLVDLPIVGSMFYKLNLNDFVVRLMARRHVYSEPRWLDIEPQRMESKRAVARARGARHASIRFVTGSLDPFETAGPFLNAARKLGSRIMIIVGSDMPARSRAEVEPLLSKADRPQVILDWGRLGVHEEFPVEVSQQISAFAMQPADE